MQLIVLDENFDAVGVVSLYRSLIWKRRYQKCGSFELYTTKDKFALLSAGRYLYRKDSTELGIIEEVYYSQDDNGDREAYAKGGFAEKLLQHRVIDTTTTLSGNMETAMRSLVERFCISPADIARAIPRLQLGEVSGITEQLDLQTTWANLGEKLYDIGNTAGVSYRVRYDYIGNRLLFEVWKGKDRRESQTENSWAVFSDSFYNIKDVKYTRSEAAYKNFAYVAGAGEGAARKVVTVDLRLPGEERKEIYVDARDLQQENEAGQTIPEAEYTAQLIQRGREKLAEYSRVETAASDIDASANLVYKKDFDLGDYCTYKHTEVGVMTEQRITEIIETYEGAHSQITVTFGSNAVTTIKELIKREV